MQSCLLKNDEVVHHMLRLDGGSPCLEIQQRRGMPCMLFTIVVVLIILWFLGMMTSYTMAGFIHVLPALIVVVVMYRVISGRKIT